MAGTMVQGTIVPSLAQAQQSEAIYWPRNEFVIPFQVDNNGQVPEEVHLEVSEDLGQSWSQCSRGDSRTRQFQYKAGRDGEYMFRLKTADSTGKLYNNPGAPLRIVVDTTKPAASLAIDMNPRGDMLAQFLASDNAINTSNITLEYQTDATPQWQAIKFDLSNSTTPGEIVGNGMWSLPNNANQLVVRLVVKDLAGNVTEVTRLPQLPRTANANAGMQFASKLLGNQPLFDAPLASGGSAAKPSSSIELGPNPNANRPSTRTMTEQEIATLRNQAGITAPGAELSSAPSPSLQLGGSDGQFEAVARLPLPLSSTASPNTNGATFGNLSNPSQIPPGFPTSFQNANGIPQSLDMPNSTSNVQRLGAPKSVANKPGIEPLNSNSRAFSLDYKIENDPGAPITEVELWGTIDQGRTWEVWGQDPDRKSPFDIEVESDGLFGFRMVIVGANGLASNRPRSGDDADAWIQVDTSKPIARITSALYGKGQDTGSIIIEYTVADDFLPERPISLFFSESPNGPWEPISRGIRNQGRFVWPTTPNLPPKLYLRIEATDLAGNITSSLLDLPIDIEGIAPRGRIQGFRPLN